MKTWLVLGAAVLILTGCGGGTTAPQKPATTKKPKKTEKAEPKKLDIKPVEVKADEFPSVEAALTELDKVLQMPDGEERNRAEIRVQMWLALQQDKAVPLVAARAADPQQSVPVRITACRILGKLGPTGVDTLLQLAGKGDSNQLRRKAIETLGGMKPPEKKTIEELISLLDDTDTQVQWQVIDALIKIGQPAKAASAKLNELRKEHADEQIRVSAGEALKKVDPRKTFVD
jgi:HEAT repeat protein